MSKIKNEGRNEKTEYPKISIVDVFPIIEKVMKKYGAEIIPYDVFAKTILGVKSPKGGTYQTKVEALKLYGLMDRHSYSEITILPAGLKILNASSNEEQNKLMFERVLAIPVIRRVYDRYKTKMPEKKKPVEDFLKNQCGMKRGASSLASIIIKDHKRFMPFIPLYLSGAIAQMTNTQNKITEANVNTISNGDKLTGYAPIIRLIGVVFPLESDKDSKENLIVLSKLAKNYNLKTFYGMIEGLLLSDNAPKLKEASEKIIKAFEEDSGIKISLENKEK